MKRRLGMGLFLLAVCCAGTSLLAQSDDDIEVGVFADYFNLSHTSPHINYVGVGGRAAFNVRSTIQIEAEMAYDFRRNFPPTTNNGIPPNFVTIGLRPLHAIFGPKFETSGGPVRLFGTFKAGLINFSATSQQGTAGFQNSLNDVTTGNTSPRSIPVSGSKGFGGRSGYAWMPGRKSTLITGPITT